MLFSSFSLPIVASLFFACNVAGIAVHESKGSYLAAHASRDLTQRPAVVERSSLGDTRRSRRIRSTSEPEVIMSTLQSQIHAISSNIQTIAKAAPSTDAATTNAQMNAEYSSLEAALNTALGGVTKLVGQLKADVNVLNLAETIVDIIADLEPALATVEAGLSEDPALAPLIGGLASLLNGPLVSLLTGLEGITSGLLPIVQLLLAGLGLNSLLAGLQGLVTGLLTALGA